MQDYNSAINICGVYDVRFHRGLFYIRCCPKGKLQEGVKGWKKLFFFFQISNARHTIYTRWYIKNECIWICKEVHMWIYRKKLSCKYLIYISLNIIRKTEATFQVIPGKPFFTKSAYSLKQFCKQLLENLKWREAYTLWLSVRFQRWNSLKLLNGRDDNIYHSTKDINYSSNWEANRPRYWKINAYFFIKTTTTKKTQTI